MRREMKRVAYWIADSIRDLRITSEEKSELYNLLCHSPNNLTAVAHKVARYIDSAERADFLNAYYASLPKKEKLQPEVVAAIIGGIVSLGTCAVTYTCKQDILRQCRSNMAFETGGGVWSTTSSQKFASMLPTMLC